MIILELDSAPLDSVPVQELVCSVCKGSRVESESVKVRVVNGHVVS